MNGSITYGGLELNDGKKYTATNLTKQVANVDTELITIPGHDGALAGQSNLKPLVMTMDIVIGDDPSLEYDTLRERQYALLGRLTGQLVEVPKNSFSPARNQGILTMPYKRSKQGTWRQDYLTYYAYASAGTLEVYIDALKLTGVTFTVPAGFGYIESIARASGNSVNFSTVDSELPLHISTVRLSGATISGGLIVNVEDDPGTTSQLIFPSLDVTDADITVYFNKRQLAYYDSNFNYIVKFADLNSKWVDEFPAYWEPDDEPIANTIYAGASPIEAGTISSIEVAYEARVAV